MSWLPEGTAGLWLAVLASGLYHGLNPGMGWPLAVSAALFEGRAAALARAMAALAAGHLVAMLAVLLPFAAMTALVAWRREIETGAALLLVGLGLWLLVRNRHPRFLARIPPHRLALWSCLIALAHGAGLMIVPLYLGLCAPGETGAGHLAAGALMRDGIAMALIVAVVHMAAMVAAGGALAWGVYRWLGLTFLRRGWFDLDRVWAASLVAVGLAALAMAH